MKRVVLEKFSDCYIWAHKIVKHSANDLTDRERHRLEVTVFDDEDYYYLDYL
jgi:hypothetical protein